MHQRTPFLAEQAIQQQGKLYFAAWPPETNQASGCEAALDVQLG